MKTEENFRGLYILPLNQNDQSILAIFHLEDKMKKLSTKVRVAEADTVSDILVRLHKESNLADEYLDS